MHVTYTTGKARSGKMVDGTTAHFVGGLFGTGEIEVTQECENGASKVHTYRSFGDGFLAWITLNIYTPKSYEIWCAADGGNAKVAPESEAPLHASKTQESHASQQINKGENQ